MPSPGKLARTILGPTSFRIVAERYRDFFVDVSEVAKSLSPFIPSGAHVLDVGGGDGAIINVLLRDRPDLTVAMVDIAPRLGSLIDDDLKRRVTMFPQTALAHYTALGEREPDVVLLSDVIHHIDPKQRVAFLSSIRDIIGDTKPLLIKEFSPRPRSARSVLGYLSDRYVSGDKLVRFMDQAELKGLLTTVFGSPTIEETRLFLRDAPNYSFCLRMVSSSAKPVFPALNRS